MTYAAVLTHVQPDADAAPRLACAVEVAKRFEATLIGIAAEMIPPLAMDSGYFSVEAAWVIHLGEIDRDVGHLLLGERGHGWHHRRVRPRAVLVVAQLLEDRQRGCVYGRRSRARALSE